MSLNDYALILFFTCRDFLQGPSSGESVFINIVLLEKIFQRGLFFAKSQYVIYWATAMCTVLLFQQYSYVTEVF